MVDARIYGMIERIDNNLGRLLNKLDELQIAEKTLVVFCSDNGGISQFFNGGMKGRKSSVYEGGVRTPCFVRWPGQIPPHSQIDAQTSHVDWLPTFCQLADVAPPDDRVIDGKSLVKLLRAGEGTEHQSFVYHTWDRYLPNADQRWAISENRWKLLCQVGGDRKAGPENWQLFDLHTDPAETRNLASKHPEIVKRLRGEFVTWFQDVTEGQQYAPVRIPVGLPGSSEVEISPSWATWQGEHIQYTFDGYDWDTIDSWKLPGESASWRLDVRQPGTYQVILHYGCRPLDKGGVLKIQAVADLPSADAVGKTEPIHHVVGATATANQFRSVVAGDIVLGAGDWTLTAEVVSTAGTELMRLNRVLLKRRP